MATAATATRISVFHFIAVSLDVFSSMGRAEGQTRPTLPKRTQLACQPDTNAR